jgi:hypothetical protein
MNMSVIPAIQSEAGPRQKARPAGCQWLMPVIVATQEAVIRRVAVRSQPGKIVLETLSRKNPS